MLSWQKLKQSKECSVRANVLYLVTTQLSHANSKNAGVLVGGYQVSAPTHDVFSRTVHLRLYTPLSTVVLHVLCLAIGSCHKVNIVHKPRQQL